MAQVVGTPHKYAEVIKAWADGKVTQVLQSHTGRWLDLSPTEYHAWTSEKYRVKPETIRYRVALFQRLGSKPFTNTTDEVDQADRWERLNVSFVRWLTDWVEVEI